MAAEDNDVDYRKWGGQITDNTTEVSNYIKANGVYWIKLSREDGIPRLKTEPNNPKKNEPNNLTTTPKTDFARPGT